MEKVSSRVKEKSKTINDIVIMFLFDFFLTIFPLRAGGLVV